jgi:hypothetical protein
MLDAKFARTTAGGDALRFIHIARYIIKRRRNSSLFGAPGAPVERLDEKRLDF